MLSSRHYKNYTLSDEFGIFAKFRPSNNEKGFQSEDKLI